MSDSVRFIHISDTHIGATPDYLLYGDNTHDALKDMVYYLNNNLHFEPDFVVHTGDLAYNPDKEAYQIAAPVLANLKYPVYYVRGNHDDADMMREFLPNLPTGEGRLDYDFQIKGCHFIVLDTFGRDHPKGYVETYQLDWLQEKCEQSRAGSVVILLHHLPTLTGNGWLDSKMYIENHDALFLTLSPFRERIRGIFFGHVHSPTTTWRDGIVCSSAAAVFSQFTYPFDLSYRPTVTSVRGFSLVTINQQQTWISHHFLPEKD